MEKQHIFTGDLKAMTTEQYEAGKGANGYFTMFQWSPANVKAIFNPKNGGWHIEHNGESTHLGIDALCLTYNEIT